MYCPHCGKFIEEKNKNKQFKWNVLGFFLPFIGFFLPFIGFILGMAWEDEKPKEAKALTLGATIAVIVIMGFVFAKLIAASFVYMFHSIFFF